MSEAKSGNDFPSEYKIYTSMDGKVQIRARFKCADGSWPALWMLGAEKGWPAKFQPIRSTIPPTWRLTGSAFTSQ